MEAEFQDSFGLLENEVIIAMTRDELRRLRVMISLGQHYLHPAFSAIGREFLNATDDEDA
jgi:hypothetical protein